LSQIGQEASDEHQLTGGRQAEEITPPGILAKAAPESYIPNNSPSQPVEHTGDEMNTIQLLPVTPAAYSSRPLISWIDIGSKGAAWRGTMKLMKMKMKMNRTLGRS
jgi:hypothetical protein